MIKNIILAATAAASLTACVEAPVSASVGSGGQRVDAGVAAGLYLQVCKTNQFNLSNARRTLERLPFTRNPNDDIFYHNTLDLSFKVGPTNAGAACSMVWRRITDGQRNANSVYAVAPDALVRDTRVPGKLQAILRGRM